MVKQKPITLDESPLAKLPDRKNKIDKWAAPNYWAEVEYREHTSARAVWSWMHQ